MIQRIQTVYLLLTTFIAALFLSGDIIFLDNGASISLMNTVSGGEAAKPVSIWPVTALLLVIPILSFLIIFLFRKRKLQMKLTALLIFVILIASVVLGYYAFKIMNSSDASIVFSYKHVLPILMLIFSVLAYRGIKKDEEIVRSYDRLR